MEPEVFTHRICPNCDRLIRERSDGAHEAGHPCFTPSYLAGYFLGLLPVHLESSYKVAISHLGIEADDAFVSGFHDGQSRGDTLGIASATLSPKAADEKAAKHYEMGRQEGIAYYETEVEGCHCGRDYCRQFKWQLPADILVEPCHCGADGCKELWVDDPQDERRLISHLPPNSFRPVRTLNWWEDPDRDTFFIDRDGTLTKYEMPSELLAQRES